MKTIHKDYWGRYTSSSRGAEAKVYAKSIELGHKVGQYRITTHYTVTEFKKASELVWEATLEARGGGRQNKVDFTKHKPMNQEEDEVAMHWSVLPGVDKLVMVEKYTGVSDDNMTLIVFVLAAILLFVILFNK